MRFARRHQLNTAHSKLLLFNSGSVTNHGIIVNDKHQRGFTLVEIVAVLITTAILAAYAIPRMMGPGEFAVRTNADRLLAALQYAQTLAQRQGVPTSMVYTAMTISVKQGGLNVKLATENNSTDYIFEVHPDVTITPACGHFTVTFGANGVPTAGAPCVFNIIENGATRFTVTVETSGYSYLGT